MGFNLAFKGLIVHYLFFNACHVAYLYLLFTERLQGKLFIWTTCFYP